MAKRVLRHRALAPIPWLLAASWLPLDGTAGESALSDVNRLELVEPYRRDCYAAAELAGATPEAARAGVDACVERRLLAAAEAIRVLRQRFPVRLTPAEVEACLGPELRPDLFLRCLREKS